MLSRSDIFACLVAAAMGLAVVMAVSQADDAPQTYGEAMAWYGDEAAAGNPEAQFLLGFALETGAQAEADTAAARGWYEKAADQGHARAQVRLALLMMEGVGGPIDQEAARGWLDAAAQQGVVDAMSLLGFVLVTLEPRDPVTAYRWFSLASEAGDPAAAANLDALRATMTLEDLEAAQAALDAWRAAQP